MLVVRYFLYIAITLGTVFLERRYHLLSKYKPIDVIYSSSYFVHCVFFALLLWEIVTSTKAGKSSDLVAKRAFLLSFLIGLTWLFFGFLAHPTGITPLIVIAGLLMYSAIGCIFGLFGWGIARIYWKCFVTDSTWPKRIVGVASMVSITALFMFVAFKLYLK